MSHSLIERDGHAFVVAKSSNPRYKSAPWSVAYRDAVACRAQTKKEVIAKFQDIDSKILKTGINNRILQLKLAAANHRFRKRNPEFKQIFGFDIPVSGLIQSFTHTLKLCPISLDGHLGTPAGVSTKEYIREKYGDEAVELCAKLIKWDVGSY